jgi:stage II sporulation protein AB (anti-sigma F factor)
MMPKSIRKHIINQMKTEFRAISENERLSRAMICAMIAQMDVTVEELADVRCAISEAVTNAVVHAYRGTTVRTTSGAESDADETSGDVFDDSRNTVYILTTLYDDRSVKIIIRDRGCGIADIRRAMEPLYTTDETGERSGMGFAIMQSFMDSVRVKSAHGRGTTVELRKKFAPIAAQSKSAEPVSGDAPAANTDVGGQEDIA